MDGGDWKAAVHGVTEGRTRLSDFSFTFHFHALEKEMATHSSVLAFSVKNKVAIGTWVYFWAFYLVPLVYISVFVPVPNCLDDCSFIVSSFTLRSLIHFNVIKLEKSTFLNSDYTTKLQSSRQFGTGTKTEI